NQCVFLAEAIMMSRHDLVNKYVFSSAYRVKLISVSQSHYDQYEMGIVQVIKEGTSTRNEKRMFLSHASCRTGLGLRVGQDYLIIGPITDVWHAGSTYVYTLGKDTWVEHWPSESECGAGSTLKVKCGELKSFAQALTKSGCQT
uniref:NTR domain-containing protein n=1 Tax=Sinocyclocheilus grahami TaxID=75366 RepID=A0A672MF95_SINGR